MKSMGLLREDQITQGPEEQAEEGILKLVMRSVVGV